MICLICSQAELTSGVTSVVLERDEFRLRVVGVPARVCPACGDAYLQQAVAEQVLSLARQRLEAGIPGTQCEYAVLQV